MDFLDNLSTATKAYVVVALFVGAGLVFFDCSSAPDSSRTDPASRSVGPPRPASAE